MMGVLSISSVPVADDWAEAPGMLAELRRSGQPGPGERHALWRPGTARIKSYTVTAQSVTHSDGLGDGALLHLVLICP